MKNEIKNTLNLLVNGTTGGIAISIGGIIFLTLENKIIGSILFSIGLLTILVFELGLYTGKVGYLFIKNTILINAKIIIFTLIGNFIGTNLIAILIKYTRIYDTLINKNISIVNVKLNDTYLSLFILAVLCGLLMFIAVDTFQKHKEKNIFIAIIMPMLCVTVFILCGFEHSIADMFYFALQKNFYLWQLLVIITGNAVGGNIIPLIQIFIEKLKIN